MEPIYYIIIAIVAVVLLVAVCVIVYTILKEKWQGVVLKTSERLRILETINEKYSFYKIMNEVKYRVTCNSKREFDRFDYNERVKGYLLEHQTVIQEWMLHAQINQRKYKEYIEEVKACESKITEKECKNLHIPFEKYLSMEDALFRKAIRTPTTEIQLKILACYTSPQGRNSYSHGCSYDERQIGMLLNTAIKEQSMMTEYQRHVAEERAKMTDSLRYDILKRDHFRCQICGASQKDGVKLHVDHIIPVSKGGKTIPSNLRTLCSRCNQGKRDKLED